LSLKTSIHFTLCSFSAAKLIHFVSIFKHSQTFSFFFFVDILNLSCHIHFSLQSVSYSVFSHYKLKDSEKYSLFTALFFLDISTNSRTFATEIKQIVIETTE